MESESSSGKGSGFLEVELDRDYSDDDTNSPAKDTLDKIKEQNKMRKSILTQAIQSRDYGNTSDESEDEYEKNYGESEDEKKDIDKSSIGSHLSATDPLLEPTKKNWDIFVNRPRMNGHELDDQKYRKYRRFLKIATFFVLFIGILIFSFLSKVSFLLAVTNMQAPLKTMNNQTGEVPSLLCFNYTADKRIVYKEENETLIRNETMYRARCVSLPVNSFSSFNDSNLACFNSKNLPTEPFLVNYNVTSSSYPATPCVTYRFFWFWAVFLMLNVPNGLNLAKSLWKFFFKTFQNPKYNIVIISCIIDTIHTAALSFICFYILPSLDDIFQAAMLLTGIAIIPAILTLINKPEKHRRIDSKLKDVAILVLNVVALLGQLSVPAVLTWRMYSKPNPEPILYISISPALFLFSLRWWENFHGDRTAKFARFKFLARLVSKMRKGRPMIGLISSPLKIFIHLGMLMLCVWLQIDKIDPSKREPWYRVAYMHFLTCSKHTVPDHIAVISGDLLPLFSHAWIHMACLNVVSAFLVYSFTTIAFKIRIQAIACTIPLALSTPLAGAFIIGGCELWNTNPCSLKSDYFFMEYFYKCYERNSILDKFKYEYYFLFFVWWCSFLWVTKHLWTPKAERLAKTSKLYMQPYFVAPMTGESICLNRNRNDGGFEIENRRERAKKLSNNPNGTILGTARRDSISALSMLENDDVDKLVKEMRKDTTPYIYICATMWHEERDEMIQMLKSIFRLDRDQAARRNVQLLGFFEPDYYEFEAHIFFDNAMENHNELEKDYTVNEYVALLVEVLKEAAKGVHDVLAKVDDPIKIPTPYGGRLQWTLPGENTLTVHLKDSAKIRHKKRWSQVMYMYYFLGFKLCADEGLSSERKLTRSLNTYTLALDGDVDFEPLALILLIDLMKREEKVGAVCGRIHPIGVGPLVWYQEFEYAIGHWLQKAAEHVLGCVLCSPGCFSLFRASALMDENVMKMYTKIPVEPREHIQYDQGEDRWLCTLLLQQGYRVEYCAASDSYTHCPVGFFEFFTQRRRWMPSTMANILSLIETRKHTVTVNENISSLYVFYQAAILIASLLSPGIIFMMMVGALNASLETWNQAFSHWGMAGLNAIPIIIFIILCFKAHNDIQLWFAWVLGALYIVIQLLVLVGTAVTMYNNNICHSTTVFFLSLTFLFVISGIIHPQEFHCVAKGIIYYVSIPTMYMLLMIYAILNLHVISWGTREVKKSEDELGNEEKRKLEMEMLKMQEEAANKGIVLDLFENFKKKTSHFMPSKDRWTCDSLCNFICCSKPTNSIEKDALDMLSARLRTIEEKLDLGPNHRDGRKSFMSHRQSIIDMTEGSIYGDDAGNFRRQSVINPNILLDIENDMAPDYSDNDSISTLMLKRSLKKKNRMDKRDELRNPSWLEDDRLGDGRVEFLDEDETEFFKDLIKRYLKPLIKDQAAQDQTAKELKDLRNSVGLVFLFANFSFVLVAFFLQFNVSSVYIPWPCAITVKDGEKGSAVLNDKLSKVDPLGFGFLVIFGICLFVQFTSMLFHRFNTFLHILSTTKVSKAKELNENDPSGMVELVQKLGTLTENELNYTENSQNSDDEDDENMKNKASRNNFMGKTFRVKPENVKQTIKEAFLSRLDKLESINKQYGDEDFIRRASRFGDLGLNSEPKTTAALMTLRNKMMTIRQGKFLDTSVFGNRQLTKTGSQINQKARIYTPHGVGFNNRKPSVGQNFQMPKHGFNY